jgi:hypothetical protein
MRKLLLACLLFATYPVMAQTSSANGQEASQPFKKANAVVITTPDSLDTAYKKIAQAILEAGYTIDRADKELHFINTKARPIARMGLQESLQASLKPGAGGSVILLSGTFASPSMAAMSPLMAGDSKVEYKGMKGSPIMACWEELQRVARLYQGGALTYKQQP